MSLEKKLPIKEIAVDTLSGITTSLPGAILDYIIGLNFVGILTARASATGMNFATSAPYGMWRKHLYKHTTKDQTIRGNFWKKFLTYTATGLGMLTGSSTQGFEEIADYFVESGKAKQAKVEIIAFNTFHVPIYAAAAAIGSLVSEGSVDFEKVSAGTLYMIAISPVAGPILGEYMDKARDIFKVKKAKEN